MNIKDKQSKLVEAMKRDPELKKYYKDIESLNETQMKQLIKVCTLLNLDQIKQLKVLASKVKTYEADINKKYNIPIVKTDEAVNEIMDDMLSIENPKAIK